MDIFLTKEKKGLVIFSGCLIQRQRSLSICVWCYSGKAGVTNDRHQHCRSGVCVYLCGGVYVCVCVQLIIKECLNYRRKKKHVKQFFCQKVFKAKSIYTNKALFCNALCIFPAHLNYSCVTFSSSKLSRVLCLHAAREVHSSTNYNYYDSSCMGTLAFSFI